MKVLITGASGFVGSHIADILIKRDYEVRCAVRGTSSLRWLEGKNIDIVDASLYNPGSLIRAVEGIDYIVHSAGLTFGRNMDEFLITNRDGTRNLLAAAEKYAPNLKRFVYISSQSAAGPSDSLVNPKTEESPCNPITSYGKSKLAGEDEVLKLCSKLPITILRPPAVYGQRDTAILPIFKTVSMGLGILIGYEDKYLSLINVGDLSRGICDAMVSDKTLGETYFITSEQFYTWNVIMDNMKGALGKDFIIKLKFPHFAVLGAAGISEFFGKFANKPPVFNFEKGIDFIQKYWICSPDKAKRDFGFVQKISLDDGINDTVKWYKDNNWL